MINKFKLGKELKASMRFKDSFPLQAFLQKGKSRVINVRQEKRKEEVFY